MVHDAGGGQRRRAGAEQLRRDVADDLVDQTLAQVRAGQRRAALEQHPPAAPLEQRRAEAAQVDPAVRTGAQLGRGGDPGPGGAVADPGVGRRAVVACPR